MLHSAWSGDPAVVVPSPPGAGKTRLVALLAATLSDRARLRVGIAAQTRDQAVELARSLSTDDSPAFVNGLLGRILELKPMLAPEPSDP